MFDELREVVYQPTDLVTGIERLLDDQALRRQVTDAARQYCFEHSWPRIAALHSALWQSLQTR
jgi:hypothetical protein